MNSPHPTILHPAWQPSPYALTNIESRWPGRTNSWNWKTAALTAQQSGFIPHKPLTAARFGITVAGHLHGTEAIAKIDANPDPKPANTVNKLLTKRDTAPPVLHEHAHSSLLIMQRIRPGTTAKETLPDPVLLGETLVGLQNLQTTETLPTLLEFLSTRLEKHPPADQPSTALHAPDYKQRRQASKLLTEMPHPALATHGDLSRGNVLHGHNRIWLIDPRGVTGDWQYDVGTLIHKLGVSAPPKWTETLIRACSADPTTVHAWAQIASAANI